MYPDPDRQDGFSRGAPVKRSVGADIVVDRLPARQGLVERAKVEITFVDVVKAFEMHTVGALHPPVQLWRIGWQNKELDTTELAGVFKGSPELRSTIDLDGSDRERRATKQTLEETGCRGGSGMAMDFELVPAGDGVARGETCPRPTGRDA